MLQQPVTCVRLLSDERKHLPLGQPANKPIALPEGPVPGTVTKGRWLTTE